MSATSLTVALAVVCLVSAVVQAGAAALVVRLFYRPKPPRVPDAELPKVAVVIALKGTDPDLVAGLTRLMRQDYPHYEMRIVVDRRDDPAWGSVEEAVRESGATNVFLQEHTVRHETCGMHCSAVVQAVRNISDECEAIVLVDGDAVGHADLIRDLVTPLVLDARVGATFGNRWYMPEEGRWGSLVRYLWNAAAVVPMCLFDIIWGGTCALRRSAVRDSGLVEKWERAIVIDAPIVSLFKALGLKTQFVPTLMMVNREECGMKFVTDFIKRQMMWTRIYSPGWWPSLVAVFGGAFVVVAAAVLAIYGLVTGSASVALGACGTLIGYLAMSCALLAILEAGVRRVVALNGESIQWCSPATALKIVLAIPLAQLVTVWATLLAAFQRDVRFRASVYQVRGPYDVRLLTYRPIEHASQPVDTRTSL